MPASARLACALAANAVLASLGLAAGALDVGGAVVGAALGVAIYLGAGWQGYLVLTCFVVLGSGFTRVGLARKVAQGTAQANRGRRGWRHALANAAVGAIAAVGVGLSDAAGWRWALVGAFAAALADTTESELGVLASRRAYLPTTWRAVPPGTEGAVSPAGTLLGAAAAALVAGLAAVVGLLPASAVGPVAIAGLTATVIESFVGARWTLSNELLNTGTTLLGALLAAGWQAFGA